MRYLNEISQELDELSCDLDWDITIYKVWFSQNWMSSHEIWTEISQDLDWGPTGVGRELTRFGLNLEISKIWMRPHEMCMRSHEIWTETLRELDEVSWNLEWVLTFGLRYSKVWMRSRETWTEIGEIWMGSYEMYMWSHEIFTENQRELDEISRDLSRYSPKVMWVPTKEEVTFYFLGVCQG